MKTRDRKADPLIRFLRKRTPAGFKALVDEIEGYVYSMALNIVRDRSLAEDVTQEVFLNVYRSIASYRGESSLGAWIYGVARRTVASRFRRRGPTLHSLDDLLAFDDSPDSSLQHADHPESLLELAERIDRMQRAFARLSDDQWDIFRMRHLEGCSIREIARRVNKTEDAVKSNLYRVRKAVLQA